LIPWDEQSGLLTRTAATVSALWLFPEAPLLDYVHSFAHEAQQTKEAMKAINQSTRRQFIKAGGIFIAASGIAGAANVLAKKEEKKNEEVSPPEDLMREHGVLKRILLIYGEAIRRIEADQDLPPEALAESAKIIRQFVEDYHEKLEEDFLFPRFRKANKLVGLVDVLLQQHQAGRRLTDMTMRLTSNQAHKNADDRRNLADSMRQFIRMYNPHEAREDTVLFPAFRGIVSAHEFDSLGEDFEKKEDELFGEDGFFKVVDRVAEIEKKLGIYDLAQFTPRT
jgi:hemerythrin-like domain-containing protein